MNPIEYIGWFSTIMLGICGIPLLLEAISRGRSSSPFLFVLMALIGEASGLIYVTYQEDIILFCNYGFNTLVYGIVMYRKVRPREIKNEQ